MNEIDGTALLSLVQDLAEFKDIVPYAGLRLKLKKVIQEHQQEDVAPCTLEVVIQIQVEFSFH